MDNSNTKAPETGATEQAKAPETGATEQAKAPETGAAAQAKAPEKVAASKKKSAKGSGKKKAPKMDAKKRQIVGEVAARIGDYPRGLPAEEINRLHEEHGLKITEPRKHPGSRVVSMFGITSKRAPTTAKAFEIWANKARREIARSEG